MHALGGGITGSRGSLLHFDPRCTEELKAYFEQAYYAEVRRVSDQAIAYFRQQVIRQQQQGPFSGSRGTVIFDIDETALSNMDGFFGSSAWSRFFGGAAADRCVRPHLEYAALEPLRLKVVAATGAGGYFGGAGAAEGAADDPDGAGGRVESVTTTEALMQSPGLRRPLCYAPPLRATLDLYNFLYDNNFTVVFLTGRSEDARAETEDNLADAGYGRKCAAAAEPGASASSAYARDPFADPYSSAFRRAGSHHHRRHQHRRQLHQDDVLSSDVLPEMGGGAAAAAAGADGAAGATVLGADSTEGDAAGVAGAGEVGAAAGVAGGAETSGKGGSGGGTAAATTTSPFGVFFSPPAAPPQRCYEELVMRTIGDDRLASVFKSEARSRLVASGRVLVGNIGDQFSDLVGQAAATANFKLPNPVYTLL